ncbi:hypothetical protein AB0E69_34130 [Kribbella sp. NPDC026611]|uniref:hypothetical protein n=1 Tax=Kribbella sp. NPDC026611 TaxID=3154911 RepID=UPI00340D6E25
MVEIRQLGGALGRPPRRPNAVGNRDAAFCLTTLSPPDDDGIGPELFAALRPWSTGRRYLNFLSGPDTAELVRDAYDATTFDALRRAKAVHDPGNLSGSTTTFPRRHTDTRDR